MEKTNEKHHFGTVCHTVLRGWWCDVLNVRAPSQDIYDDSQESFCKELEQVFDQFPKHHIKILLWEFSATLQRPYNCGRWDHCAISNVSKWMSSDRVSHAIKLIPQDTSTLTTGNESVLENRKWQWCYSSKWCYIQKCNCQEHSVALFKPWSMHVNLYWWKDSQSDQTCLDERRRYSYLTSIISEELPVTMITIC